jgi:hypothetical protein
MKKPSPRIVKLIFKAALKDAKHLDGFSNMEISFLCRLGIGELSTYGFSIEESVKLLLLIREELYSRD